MARKWDISNEISDQPTLSIRPYQLLCIICSIGEGNDEPEDAKLREIFKAIRQDPDLPLTLRCNIGDIFAYQDTGPEDDNHGCHDFNRKRDMDVLQRLDLPPGITLPARIILHRLWDKIESVSGICGYDEIISEEWKGCPKARSGFYEKGRRICLDFAVFYPDTPLGLNFSESDLPKTKNLLIVPRTKEERAETKKRSLEAMYQADAIEIRPHHLVEVVTMYGQGLLQLGSVEQHIHNLPEFIHLVIKKPETKIKLTPGATWMICSPCPCWMPRRGACVLTKGYSGLTNQYRDVRTLQKLGLKHGDVINARELYQLIFERVNPDDVYYIWYGWDNKPGSLWCDWGDIPPDPKPSYAKGREMLMKEFGFNKNS